MPVSKSRRFEVFKRDGFTCQYCGSRPPEVVLEVDHIDPRALGGADEELNLITSCADCNRGKSAKRLGDVRPRPDADIAYLETQQEVVEAQRYLRGLNEREEAIANTVEGLQTVWVRLTEKYVDWMPSSATVRQFLNRYSATIVETAFRDVAPKVASGYLDDRWIRYAWTVMRRLAEDGEPENPLECARCHDRKRSLLCVACTHEMTEIYNEIDTREVTRIVPR